MTGYQLVNLFNTNMTSSELRTAFFRAVDGKTAEETEKLKEDYFNVQSIIMKREFALAEEGWCID